MTYETLAIRYKKALANSRRATAAADAARRVAAGPAKDQLTAELAAIPAGRRGAPAARAAAAARFAAAVHAATRTEAKRERAAERRITHALAELREARAALADTIMVAVETAKVLRHATMNVRFGTPYVKVVNVDLRDKYSKAWHRQYGPAHTTETTVRVPSDWLAAVHANGLAVCDGMMTLDAEPVGAPAGYSAWAAVWIEQGRGHAATAVSGVIVRAGGRGRPAAHASTVEQGITLLRRRARAEYAVAASRTADLSEHRHVHVSLADSRAVGNCNSGTRSWCARAGIDPAVGATVGDVLDALAAGAGLDSSAIAACRHAVARAMRVMAPAQQVAA